MSANFIQVSKYTLSEEGLVTTVSVFTTNATGIARGVIYADSVGSPTTLMAVSNEVTFATSGDGWTVFTLPSAVLLPADDYWLGFFAGANTTSFYSDTVTNNRKYKADTYDATPIDPFGAPTATDNVQIQVYATYTAVATTTFMPPPRLGRVRGG
jgi:hypothetical protein